VKCLVIQLLDNEQAYFVLTGRSQQDPLEERFAAHRHAASVTGLLTRSWRQLPRSLVSGYTALVKTLTAGAGKLGPVTCSVFFINYSTFARHRFIAQSIVCVCCK